MKKTLKILVSIVVLMVVLCSFMACQEGPQTKAPTKENKELVLQDNGVIIIVADAEYIKKASSNTLQAYMDVLVDEGLLTYTGTEGAYGLYITEVNGINTKSANESWMIYASSLTNASDSGDYNYTYDNKTWYPTNFGVSQMPIEEGTKYLFTIITF